MVHAAVRPRKGPMKPTIRKTGATAGYCASTSTGPEWAQSVVRTRGAGSVPNSGALGGDRGRSSRGAHHLPAGGAHCVQ